MKDLFLIAGYFGDHDVFLRAVKERKLSFRELREMRWVDGSSLLEQAIGNRKYDTAEYLLRHGVPINVVTQDGNNEFHYLASWILEEHALEIGWKLLKKGVDLAQQDTKYGNTAMFILYMKLLPWAATSEMHMKFLKACLAKQQGIYETNKAGYCVKTTPINEHYKEILPLLF